MPTSYVEKMAKKHNMTVQQAEEKWSEAKKAAEKQGQGDNYAYITTIFKSMVGEKSSLIASLRQALAADDAKDSVCLDVPLLTRVMEICREEIKDDASLHRFLESIIDASKGKDVLTMDDYDSINPGVSD